MKSLYITIKKFIVAIFVGMWDFVFFFFGFPYEKQAEKMKLDEIDDVITGPENEKTTHRFYRANKVSKES